MRTLFEAVGPEQVSPHYESLTRSRRGLLFLFAYIGSITTISRLGGWSHNEWLRGMIWHHEFLLAWYIGYIEVKHFTFLLGPKFSIFYNVYSRYETQQMCNQWADVAEEIQMRHLTHTKEQIEYVRVNDEYDFVKQRALVNFLGNSRTDLEGHMHNRANSMLNLVAMYEGNNLKKFVTEIGTASMEKVTAAIADPAQKDAIMESAFQSALNGIRAGVMDFKGDPLMPILVEEVTNRTQGYKNLTDAEESDMLSVTAD